MPKATCFVVDGNLCGRPVLAKGMCSMHYQRWRSHGNPLVVVVKTKAPPCSVVEDGEICGRPHESQGLCGRHYQRALKTGDPLVLVGTRRGDPLLWLVRAVASRDRSVCWIDWPYATASIPPYPCVRFAGAKHIAGHVAMSLDGRPKPAGEAVEMCHSPRCLSSMCLNPDHLRWDTRSENTKDRKRAGWETPNPVRGEMFRRAKLTEADIRAMRAAHADGALGIVLAERYGVTTGMVSRIINGKAWAHVVDADH